MHNSHVTALCLADFQEAIFEIFAVFLQSICKVSKATVEDVDEAVEAAKEAFEGPWSSMNPRDRGMLMFKYADSLD